jgi:hypothetical protein
MAQSERQLSTSDLAGRNRTSEGDAPQQDRVEQIQPNATDGDPNATDGDPNAPAQRRSAEADVSDTGRSGNGSARAQAADTSSVADPISKDEDREETHAALVEPGEAAELQSKWTTIQVDFVDQPRDAVARADELVAQCMQQLATRFADERNRLEQQWSSGDDVDTEDLRIALRRYRSFFQRLLSA